MAAQFHLADLFEIVAGAVGDRIAIRHDGGAISYAGLNARADRLAAALADRGIGRGATVGLYLMNGPEYLEGFLAAMKCGAVPFNINYRYRAEELRYLLDNADAAAVIHGAAFAPLMHGAATWGSWSALLGGLTVVLDPVRHFDAEAIWDKVEREQVNIVAIVGDAMAVPLRDALYAHPGRWNLQHVVNFGSGGAVFSAHVKADIKAKLPPKASITDGMGSSEIGISGMAEASEDGVMRLPANADQQVVVGDRFAVAGETGLIARSGHTPVGYYGDPVKTAETFRTIGGRLWAVSGDSGRLDADGRITMLGRGSTCINTGGEKVFPEEVESALRTHPAILDAVVAGQKDARWGERVVGIVSRRDGVARPSLDEVSTHLKRQLAGYKLPKALVWVDAVKRSPAGKQDYRWARELAGSA
ncbi:MAG: AMP-binding protein [Sphingomonas bacterium]